MGAVAVARGRSWRVDPGSTSVYGTDFSLNIDKKARVTE